MRGLSIILKKRKAFEMCRQKTVIKDNNPYLCNMKQQIIGLLSLMTFFCVPVVGQTAQQWRDSLTMLNRQIAAAPDSMDLHLRKAAVNIELGQWEYAADEYTLVLAKDARNPAARFYRAYTNAQLKRYDLALFDYEELLRLTPAHYEARLGHSYVQQKMGRRMEALDELNLMVEMFPDSTTVYVARAGMEQEMGQRELALYDWEQAERLDTMNADYVLSHAELLIQLKRYDEARYVLDAAIGRGIPQGYFHQLYARLREERSKK